MQRKGERSLGRSAALQISCIWGEPPNYHVDFALIVYGLIGNSAVPPRKPSPKEFNEYQYIAVGNWTAGVSIAVRRFSGHLYFWSYRICCSVEPQWVSIAVNWTSYWASLGEIIQGPFHSNPTLVFGFFFHVDFTGNQFSHYRAPEPQMLLNRFLVSLPRKFNKLKWP